MTMISDREDGKMCDFLIQILREKLERPPFCIRVHQIQEIIPSNTITIIQVAYENGYLLNFLPTSILIKHPLFLHFEDGE